MQDFKPCCSSPFTSKYVNPSHTQPLCISIPFEQCYVLCLCFRLLLLRKNMFLQRALSVLFLPPRALFLASSPLQGRYTDPSALKCPENISELQQRTGNSTKAYKRWLMHHRSDQALLFYAIFKGRILHCKHLGNNRADAKLSAFRTASYPGTNYDGKD